MKLPQQQLTGAMRIHHKGRMERSPATSHAAGIIPQTSGARMSAGIPMRRAAMKKRNVSSHAGKTEERNHWKPRLEKEPTMKLPENSNENRIYREARRNPYRPSAMSGVEPMFLIDWGKKIAKRAACFACDRLPVGKALCRSKLHC